ncbi:MAG: hypothetical protein ACP5OC_07675 [Thermoplasmata archaeon]
MEKDQIRKDPGIEEIASRIAQMSPVKSFPDDYLPPDTKKSLRIPVGSDILMFRQDEFIVVSIDSRRVYLRSNVEAKYVFYSAKRGQEKIASPADLDIDSAITKLEHDLDVTLAMINGECSNLSQKNQNDVRVLVSKLLGYSDIF